MSDTWRPRWPRRRVTQAATTWAAAVAPFWGGPPRPPRGWPSAASGRRGMIATRGGGRGSLRRPPSPPLLCPSSTAASTTLLPITTRRFAPAGALRRGGRPPTGACGVRTAAVWGRRWSPRGGGPAACQHIRGSGKAGAVWKEVGLCGQHTVPLPPTEGAGRESCPPRAGDLQRSSTWCRSPRRLPKQGTLRKHRKGLARHPTRFARGSLGLRARARWAQQRPRPPGFAAAKPRGRCDAAAVERGDHHAMTAAVVDRRPAGRSRSCMLWHMGARPLVALPLPRRPLVTTSRFRGPYVRCHAR